VTIPQNNDLEQFGDERPILKQIRELDDKITRMVASKSTAHQRHWNEIEAAIAQARQQMHELIVKFNEQDETK